MNFQAILTFLVERGNEPSTWRGIANILTAAGVVLSPEHMELIVAGGLFVSGLIGAATKDKIKSE